MAPPTLYVAITNHGFGHATRTASVVAEIQNQCPEIQIIWATTSPQWLLDSYLHAPVTYRQRSFDIGVIQSDSVTMDKAATLEKLQYIRANQDSTIADEADFLRHQNVGLVLADIPPLAAPIAHAAGIPCWMMSNFGWDLIYRDWGGEFVAIADWIQDCFRQCDRLFRLPFHEPMSAFPTVEDVGLTGGTPRFSTEELRHLWHISAPPEQTVLLTFGGLGLAQIPYEELSRLPDWQFITFAQNAPDLPNLLKITDRRYRPVDVMPLCSRIVSKPGYGTFSEACQLRVPMIAIEREGFAEAAFLMEGLRRHAYHRILKPEELFNGTWEFLTQPLCPPQDDSLTLAKDGNGAIARAVVNYLMSL
ncbi:MAG: glycosyl transferase [Leptolyngbyaceae bacterium]|nr:glycosyl transferase [Leptolyngbyaceae bacterium]